TDIRGNLDIDTRFGLARVELIKGSLDVDNANGGVTATDVSGGVRVHTSFAPVLLKTIAGRVTVENANGSISVSDLRGVCADINLKTSFASIKLDVPRNDGYYVDARTSFGSITTAIPFILTSRTENALIGRIGNGTCHMFLQTTNGGIELE
ncbi:MAG TPA: hypothetical protein VNN08_12335, partial [Thermoanaerobaculia bacterium]|nr:hypothetical protein [Thermoanaerobaculia bacterium]